MTREERLIAREARMAEFLAGKARPANPRRLPETTKQAERRAYFEAKQAEMMDAREERRDKNKAKRAKKGGRRANPE